MDNKLRCALVLRIENASSQSIETTTTLLTKYDYAGQDNDITTSSSDDEEDNNTKPLYGKGLDYSVLVQEAIASDPILIVLGDNSADNNGNFGGFKVIQSDSSHQLIYGADDRGICVAVITGQRYPSRIAITMLKELYTQFQFHHGEAAVMAPKGGSSSKGAVKEATKLLRDFCDSYADPTNVDSSQKVLSQVENVKGRMQDNIANMLHNTENAEALAERSDQLNEQADIFRIKSTALKKDMWWKNIKTNILLLIIAAVVLLIIVVPIFFH